MLTDTQIKSLKPKDKLYRKLDSQRLYIEIAVSGSKIWQQKYNWQKKETMKSLGHYPAIGLSDARRRGTELRELVREGINPKQKDNTLTMQKDTFRDMFFQWHNYKKGEWSADYSKDTIQRAECYLLPFIGSRPIDEITAPDMRDLLLKIQDKGVLDTLQKIKSIAVRVFKYSVGMGVIKANPVADLPSDIFKTKPKTHYATITDPTEIGWLLNILDKHKGSWQVGKALQLAPYMMLRPGELTKLTWKEVDFEARLIRVSEQTMKMKIPHLVPMSRQVYNTFEELSQIDTNSDYVFPSSRNRNKSITTNSLLVALDALGVPKDKLVTHGFRHMASTRLNELGFRGEVIERQLSHTDRDKIRATYNHAEYLDERKEMMQFWADYLDKLKEQHNLTSS